MRRLLLLSCFMFLLFTTSTQSLNAQNFIVGTVYAVDWSPDGSKIAIGGGLDYCVPEVQRFPTASLRF